jgi:hypothetical protein
MRAARPGSTSISGAGGPWAAGAPQAHQEQDDDR